METKRLFEPDTDRYAFDFGPCSYENGFAQVDTAQDASYFGTWCSPQARTVVSYAEGDITIKVAETDEEFVTEIRELVAWNEGHGHGPARIDPGFSPDMKAQFERIGIADLLH